MKKLPRVAIVYDRVNKFGGAERVLQSLHKLFPTSILYTSVYEPRGAAWVNGWEVRTSFLQHVPFARRHHEWFSLLMPLAFESLDLHEFDIVISVTSEFAKCVITTPDQLHICYCLTPTRYLWSHTREYAQGGFSLLKRSLFSILRIADFAGAHRPDVFIAISSVVKKRIETYYRRKVVRVIHPPTTISLVGRRQKPKRSYYIAVARLVPYKRMDLVIEACILAKRHVHIVGTGTDADRLATLAGDSPYIHFEGRISDKNLSVLYQGARALLCPQIEDFGLVSVEAQSCGIPVLSYVQSGMAETVSDGRTGILFSEQSVASLVGAMRMCEKKRWNPSAIRRHAHRFSERRFGAVFRGEVMRIWREREV